MQLPLNVSPVSASFIGLMRQGILLVLSLACHSCLLLVCFRHRESMRGAHQDHLLASSVLVLIALGTIEIEFVICQMIQLEKCGCCGAVLPQQLVCEKPPEQSRLASTLSLAPLRFLLALTSEQTDLGYALRRDSLERR
jgi:hypothetical protein